MNRSLNVFPDCPTYWMPHLVQLITLITFLDLQLKRPLSSEDIFICQDFICVVFCRKGQVIQGLLHGALNFWGLQS